MVLNINKKNILNRFCNCSLFSNLISADCMKFNYENNPVDTSADTSSYAETMNMSSISSSSSGKRDQSRVESKSASADFSSICIYSPDVLVGGSSSHLSASMVSSGPRRNDDSFGNRDDFTTWMSPVPSMPPWMGMVEIEENNRMSLSVIEEPKDLASISEAGDLPLVHEQHGCQEYTGTVAFMPDTETFLTDVGERHHSLVKEAKDDRSLKKPRRT